MSKLATAFRAKASKSKDPRMYREGAAPVAYSTGFMGLDFLNGTVCHYKREGKKYSYNSVGILDSACTVVIGRSGCGKTTLLNQIAGNIIRPFKTSCFFLDDIEGGSPQSRLAQLLKMNSQEFNERVIYRNSGITTENLYERIKMIRDEKMENSADYEYDTGLFDSKGNRIIKMEPTVYMVDSIPLIMPEELSEEDELKGSMSATAIAKANTSLFKKINQFLKDANIILLCINHILEDVQIGPFPKKGQLSYLKQGERLPGGRAAIYLANNMIRLDDGTKLKADSTFGIDGCIVDAQMVKSRTNKVGRSIPLIFSYTDGCFDPELSLFQLLKSEGKINGSGVGMYIGDRNDIKFSHKNFKEKLIADVELQRVFSDACYDVLYSLLSVPDDDDDELTDTNTNSYACDVSNLILNRCGISEAA